MEKSSHCESCRLTGEFNLLLVMSTYRAEQGRWLVSLPVICSLLWISPDFGVKKIKVDIAEQHHNVSHLLICSREDQVEVRSMVRCNNTHVSFCDTYRSPQYQSWHFALPRPDQDFPDDNIITVMPGSP
ncbi:hypothetical protein RRG08_028677 [Elysia crispata]|uniref:Uncharacterized protein n=1 Tax=Elysia crispata TaxID=231223 RepID=A0AAE1DDC2_9GAST|nr:hypothetical protein RRG08_028677 [Elysia crispata]